MSALEAVKLAARDAAYREAWCGMDRFLDNHFAWSRRTLDAAGLVALMAALDGAGVRFHCQIGGIYVHEPTGDAIFISRNSSEPWSDDDNHRAGEGSNGTIATAHAERASVCLNLSPPAGDLCSQGYCNISDLNSNLVCVDGGITELPTRSSNSSSGGSSGGRRLFV